MIQGILNYSDWLSSDKRATITTADSANLFTMGCDFIPNPYHYQLTAKEILGNILITLPTGSGKTETAIMWIMTNFSPGSRIFYTLPTRTTINAMYQRLIDPSRKYGLDKNVVAEYFSNVDLRLKSNLIQDSNTSKIDEPIDSMTTRLKCGDWPTTSIL